MSKAKQKIEINGVPFGVAGIGMSDSTYKQLPANVKQGNKLTTLSHLRNCVQQGEFLGDFTIGNHSGYLFKHQEYNVLVDKDVRMVLAAYKEKTESPVHICKPKINKSSIKPLKVVETKPVVNQSSKMIQIGDLAIDVSNIELTKHFLDRCKERFYITDKEYARKFMEDKVLNGEYLGVVSSGDHKSHSFSKNGIGVFIDLDGKTARTAYEQDENLAYPKPKELIKSILQKKINKLQQQKYKIYKRNTLSTLEINKQIADYELKKYRAKSHSKKLAYEAYINGLEELKQQYEVEHLEISKELNHFTKSMIAFT